MLNKKNNNKEEKIVIKNNKDRAFKIKKILGLNGQDTDEEYYRVADVICDLMHYCDYNKEHPDGYKIEWENEMNSALGFYEGEKEIEDLENKPQANQQKG